MKRYVSLIVIAVGALCSADDSGYPWRETGYIPVAAGTPEETTLMYQVMFPNPEHWGPGPYPLVVDYSGYEPATTIFDGLDDRMLAAGYAVAGVNMRGTHGSGGSFDYFHPQQARDGADAITWLAQRTWSTRRVAMAGKSWPGISQLYVAAQQPEGLVAIVPGHVFSDLYRDVAFPGGIMNVTFDSYWSLARVYEGYLTGPLYYSETNDEQALTNQLGHLPNILMNPVIRVLTHQYDDAFFHERSNWYFADQIRVPTFLIQAWQDEQVGSRAAEMIEQFDPSLTWRFAAANGDHAEYYGPEIFPHILRFLSYYLKQEIPAGEQRLVTAPLILPNGKPHPMKKITRPETYEEALARFEAEDRVLINWENGARGGRSANWTQTYAHWPPPNQVAWRLNLFPDGTLRDEAYPDPQTNLLTPLVPKQLGAVDYEYAPLVGVQERGGYNIEEPVNDTEAVPPGDWSDRPPQGTFAEFTSSPLAQDTVLLGPASADLYIASTAVDTDFEVTLSEVRPDGYETFVQQGWLRASHRREDPSLSTPLRPYHTHQLTDSALLIAGEPTKVRIEVFPFAHPYRAGSRIRIGISAPHTHPDLWGFAPMPLPAINTIFTSKTYPSSLALPLLLGDVAHAPLPPPGSLRNQPTRIAQETANGVDLSTLLPPADATLEEMWLNQVAQLSGAGEFIGAPDATTLIPEVFSPHTWAPAWFLASGNLSEGASAGVLSPDTQQSWEAYAASIDWDLSHPDEWFVQAFDDWFALQTQ